MSGKICAMIHCTNYGMINTSKSFHNFPRNKELSKKWVVISKRGDLYETFRIHGALKPYTYFICSDHFKPEDYVNPENKSQGLKRDSVPSVNLPPVDTTRSRRRPKKRTFDEAFNQGIQ